MGAPSLPLPHNSLPPPFDIVASSILLEDVPSADSYLISAIVVLTSLAFIQLRAFARPHPVPLKNLPKRPALSILLKPDDASTTSKLADSFSRQAAQRSSLSWSRDNDAQDINVVRASGDDSVTSSTAKPVGSSEFEENAMDLQIETVPSSDADDVVSVGEISVEADYAESISVPSPENPLVTTTDLPDSFAPLLSSSQMEVITSQLTADLVHAVRVDAGIRMREGRHEIPLNKDESRPQLQLNVPKDGCKLTLAATVGSDGLSNEQDLDVTRKTASRSKPMVKHAGIVLDPPLLLSNVAPTLIHFPTLFEDKFVPKLRQFQIIRMVFDLVISISSFLEKCLWIIESQCHIHLSTIKVAPIYKGKLTSPDTSKESKSKGAKESFSPDWRLSLSFSGHVLLFGFIPIPFISVSLPTFIIPQPHALLDYLLTPQPLASARLKRENIDEKKILLALVHTAESWTTQLKLVATPPSVGVDITLPGGVTVALEMGLGRDPHAHHNRGNVASSTAVSGPQRSDDVASINSMSSWSTGIESPGVRTGGRATVAQFDANNMVPWLIEFAAKGSVRKEKLSFHVSKMVARHEEVNNGMATTSQFGARGSFAVWKVQPGQIEATESLHPRKPTPMRSRRPTFGHPELHAEDSPSVASILMSPTESASLQEHLRLLQYDYVFDVYDNSKIDAITMSIGAKHPFLSGGTMVTTILDSIYAYGTVSARPDAVLDPGEFHRKRNILRHLPAPDFHFGIQNIYIPEESESYSDDGQTLVLPRLEKGRMRVHLAGGMDKKDDLSVTSNLTPQPHEVVTDGIKVVADFEAPSLQLRSEGVVKEFPELDIFDGVKLRTNLHGMLSGSIRSHLRPQQFIGALSTTGPNVFNPLEAYEIDFSGTCVSIKMKEYTISIGHRRIIFPSESTFAIDVTESVVDMGFEGKTRCQLGWDFQGLSPILQVAPLGQSPEVAEPENKEQVSILIAPLRQGRLTFHVSSVGGISITKAATSREDKEGLFDWKFFNALVSPDDESAGRILDVIHDRRTMDKMLQVIKLVNQDLFRILKRVIEEVWRSKEILDKEGVSDPKHAIPMYKMSRLVSLFLTGSVDDVDEIFPLVKRVVRGEGLDVVKAKELLRQNIEHYDDWAPEIDRAVRLLSVAFGPMSAPHFVEEAILPLTEVSHHAEKFGDIPSAAQLYTTLSEKLHLPIEPLFSNLVSQVAPYLTFRQVEFILQARNSTDWQASDLRRIRYVYSIKRKVLEIAESYGGLSFLPQSFFLSVFLGEATRSSHRAQRIRDGRRSTTEARGSSVGGRSSHSLTHRAERRARPSSILGGLRKKRGTSHTMRRTQLGELPEEDEEDAVLTPAARIASNGSPTNRSIPQTLVLESQITPSVPKGEAFDLGDSLLGPQDVATLLQAGLTSVMKSSTVVQLNQRMLLDLICSQPRSFAVAVLAEIGSPSGQGSPRNLTSALMALLELDQTSFKPNHQIDMHTLLESWLPGLKIPRREDYMAGGRWARQSYYEAIFAVSKSILDDAETYMAVKGHVQRMRHREEVDPLATPKCEAPSEDEEHQVATEGKTRIVQAVEETEESVRKADAAGKAVLQLLLSDEEQCKTDPKYKEACSLYNEAFEACRRVLSLDKYAFHLEWFRVFYRRNYDALMIKSMFDNVKDNTDQTRRWLNALRIGALKLDTDEAAPSKTDCVQGESVFLTPEKYKDQELVDAILDATIFEEKQREELRADPLVRLLLPNPPGKYDFAIVSAMGVITEGKKGLELHDAFDRLHQQRGVLVIRSDTATARSFEYNASKIEEAIEIAVELKKPYGLLGYSQGCANVLMAETLLLSGSPKQQRCVDKANGGLVCRQLLFSAANGSFHGPAMERKIQRLIVMCEEFFKYQQGYVSRALSSFILDAINSFLDSSAFHKAMGGAQSFLPDGCRAFWREAQHLDDVPTCTLRGVLEPHTTPESLEMISHLLTKQSGSPLHDSQVHVFDAVGYPVYFYNRNGRVLKKCAIGDGAIQRTHHWSPLSDEVEFVRTAKDVDLASFDCAKDRHVFPWVDVNARFGFIKYLTVTGDDSGNNDGGADDNRKHATSEAHPSKLLSTRGSSPSEL